jgi:hypothetical protein
VNEDPGKRGIAQHQQFVSEIFHTIGQPLTELQLSLELALEEKLTIKGYKQVLRQALAATERAIASAEFMRRLAEAEDPGSVVILDFSAMLSEVVEEFEPVAESRGAEIEPVIEEALNVAADPARMKRALYLLMDYALHLIVKDDAQPGTRMQVAAAKRAHCVECELTTRSQELLSTIPIKRTERFHPSASTPARAGDPGLSGAPHEPRESNETVGVGSMHSSMQIAVRMMAAIGGSLVESRNAGGACILLRLPLPPHRTKIGRAGGPRPR